MYFEEIKLHESDFTPEELIKYHLEEIMKLLGIEETESNKDTPKRIAKMWVRELFENINLNNYDDFIDSLTTFPAEGYKDLVLMRNMPFNSMCEHHFLPFSGKVSVAYIPKDRIIGLSKIPRIVRYFSKMPQLQERFTKNIGDTLDIVLGFPKLIIVRVEADHQCVKCRGAESDCSTVTIKTWTDGFADPDLINQTMKQLLSSVEV